MLWYSHKRNVRKEEAGLDENLRYSWESMGSVLNPGGLPTTLMWGLPLQVDVGGHGPDILLTHQF